MVYEWSINGSKRGDPVYETSMGSESYAEHSTNAHFPMTELVPFDPKLLFSLTQKWSQNMTMT